MTDPFDIVETQEIVIQETVVEELIIEFGIGPPGVKGDTGISAYQVWLNQGNSGTIDDFLNSLKFQGQGFSNITVGTTAPASPSIGDIWIDTN